MSTLAELSEEDQGVALALFQKMHNQEERQKEDDAKLKQQIKLVYKKLNIPDTDRIQITSYQLSRTIIHGYSIELFLRQNQAGTSQYNADHIGRNVYHESLENRSADSRYSQDAYNSSTSYHKQSRGNETTHHFFVNQINICPFCGIPKESEDKTDWGNNRITRRRAVLGWFDRWSWDVDESLTASALYTEPVSYKRCKNHKDISRKEYLAGWAKNPRAIYGEDNEEKKSLYESIYPPTIKYTKKHYAEKRVKKVTRKRLLTQSEIAFFSMMIGAQKLTTLIKTNQ